MKLTHKASCSGLIQSLVLSLPVSIYGLRKYERDQPRSRGNRGSSTSFAQRDCMDIESINEGLIPFENVTHCFELRILLVMGSLEQIL